MVQIYLKDVPEGEPPQPTSWHEAPSKARIEQVASLLYREATGQSQIYPELAPRTQTPVTQGAFGYPPAIFVKTSEGGDGFMQDFKWAKLDQQGNFVLDTIANYLTAAQKNWPDFAQRLDELNHKYANGSRTGDIVIVMNGKQGYLGVTKQDQLNGWHGGPTRAESDVPLMFGMPGPDLLPETSDKLDAAYHQIAKRPNSSYYRNWQMGEILLNMLKQFRQKP